MRRKVIAEKTFKNLLLIIITLFFNISFASAQLSVNAGMTPVQLIQNVLVGTGVTVSNVTYAGGPGSLGEFTTGISPTNLGLTSGIIMSTGLVNGTPAIGSPAMNFASNINGGGTDPNLQALIPGYTIDDASVLQFDFVPISDTIKFRYVFGSEEYPEWVGSSYNDVFGFFISGINPLGGTFNNLNIALIPGTALPVTIDNVNSGSYSGFYIDNQGINGQTIVYDGFTVVLTAWCRVQPCTQYHIKLAVGDAGDQAYDSGVFLEANSFSSNGISYNTHYTSNVDTVAVEGCNNAIIAFLLNQPAQDTLVINYTISGTGTEGMDYPWLPDSLFIFPGQDSTAFLISPFSDGFAENWESVYIAYENTVCGTLDTILIWIKDYDSISTTVTDTTFVCNGTPVYLNVLATDGYPPLHYLWSTGDTVTNIMVTPPIPSLTRYIISVTDACNFATIDTVVIGMSNLSTGLIHVDSVSCNNYSDGSLTVAQYNGLSPFQYVWQFNALPPFQSLMNTHDTTNTADSLVSGIYTVTVTDSIGCTSVDTITLKNPKLLQIHMTAINENCLDSCNGQIIIDSIINPFPPYSYVWSTDIPQSTSDATGLCAGDYTVTMTYSPNNCYITATSTVLTNTILDASFIANPTEGYVPLTVNFTSFISCSGNCALNYLWNFDDNGATSSEMNPSYIYNDMGEYTVTLTVNSGDPDYCEKKFLVPVNVVQTSSIEVPNVFTPNGDYHNDSVTVKSEGIRSFKMVVFNRWGKKVFETPEADNGFSNKMQLTNLWDGTNMHGGAPCATGVYFYIIEAVGFDTKEYKLNGSVQLLR